MIEPHKIRPGQKFKTDEGETISIQYILNDEVEVLIDGHEDQMYAGRYSVDSLLTSVDLKLIPRCYLAGPMSGYPDNNYPAFFAEEKVLQKKGYEVLNPAANDDPPGKTWRGYMEKAVSQLITCDHIHLMEGWSKSKGGVTEYNLAKSLGLEITFQNEKAANEQIEK